MVCVVVAEEELGRFNSKPALSILARREGLGIAHGLPEVPGVLGEADLAVHSLGYLLVI